jgi:quercetin dioxygenase-like cupin family protein
MTDGLVLPPGAGQRVQGAGMTLKVGADRSRSWSMFEAEVQPGFDVGAHRHREAEEVFYILDGELDLLAFEPRDGTSGDWRSWQSQAGATVVRGGPGSVMVVPPGCPHAFANPGSAPVRMLFLVAPPGHEYYLEELGALLANGGPPDQAAIAALRARHDITQLTPMRPGRALRGGGGNR